MKAVVSKDDISMTQQAIEHVHTMLAERGHGSGLRLSIKTLGCSGYAYDVGFLDKADANDKVFAINSEIKIAVDSASFEIIKGTVIDFVSEGLTHQFKFNNPNVKDLCGCGESFSI